MLTALFAFLIDGFGAYFLTQKFNRWIALIPLAVILGIVSSIASNVVAYFVAQGVTDATVPSGFYVVEAFKGAVKHTIWSLFFIWLIRRKKSKASEVKVEQVN
jgi:uncharacterized membrane protein